MLFDSVEWKEVNRALHISPLVVCRERFCGLDRHSNFGHGLRLVVLFLTAWTVHESRAKSTYIARGEEIDSSSD